MIAFELLGDAPGVVTVDVPVMPLVGPDPDKMTKPSPLDPVLLLLTPA